MLRSESRDHTVVVMEEALDFVGSDSRCGSDIIPLETIRLRWKETSKSHSLLVLFSRGFGIVLTLERLRAIGVCPSEYRVPIAAAGLFARDELHSLSLHANLLGQWMGKREQGSNSTCAYPAVITARTARLSDNT